MLNSLYNKYLLTKWTLQLYVQLQYPALTVTGSWGPLQLQHRSWPGSGDLPRLPTILCPLSAIFSSDTVSYVWFPQLSTPVTGIAAVRQFTSNISHFKVFKMLIRVHEESFVLFFFNSFILLDKKPFLIAMFCLLGTILAFMMMGNKLIKGNELPGVIQ